jgi:hypothetical protein
MHMNLSISHPRSLKLRIDRLPRVNIIVNVAGSHQLIYSALTFFRVLPDLLGCAGQLFFRYQNPVQCH